VVEAAVQRREELVDELLVGHAARLARESRITTGGRSSTRVGLRMGSRTSL
jgi:hypothetical protein